MTSIVTQPVLVHDIRSVFAILAPQILNDWKFVLRRLGISDLEIQASDTSPLHLQEIIALNRTEKPAEVVYRGLIRWENNHYGKPSLDALFDALTELKLYDAANTISKYRVIGVRPLQLVEMYRPPRRQLYLHQKDFSLQPKRKVTDRELGDDLVVSEILHPLARYRYKGARHLAANQQRVPVHPLATFRVPISVTDTSFDQVQDSPFYHPDRPRRHSWSMDVPLLLYSRLQYSYISQVISPPTKFNREPWFVAVDFLNNGDVILLDKENKQVEVHKCRILPKCRRYVFSHSFRVSKDVVGCEPSDMAVFNNYVIVIDKGQWCMRVFTTNGRSTGSVKFRKQPRCLAVHGFRVAIAFWDLPLARGSIVLYNAEVNKFVDRNRKLTLVNPRHVESARDCYDSVGITSHGDVVALSQEGCLSLHTLEKVIRDKYVCRNEASIPRVRSMVVKGNVVVLCNTYHDHISAVGFTSEMPRTFDLTNMNVIMDDDDGLYAPRVMAFYNDDLALVHKYGADVRVFGMVTWPKPPKMNRGLVTFRY